MPNERGWRESGFFGAETVDRLGSGSRTPADVARSVRAGDGPARHRADQGYAVSRGRDIVRAARRRLCLGFRVAGAGLTHPPPDFCRSGGNALSDHRRCAIRSEEHTSELQSLMRISYAVFCLKKKNTTTHNINTT